MPNFVKSLCYIQEFSTAIFFLFYDNNCIKKKKQIKRTRAVIRFESFVIRKNVIRFLTGIKYTFMLLVEGRGGEVEKKKIHP